MFSLYFLLAVTGRVTNDLQYMCLCLLPVSNSSIIVEALKTDGNFKHIEDKNEPVNPVVIT